MNPRKLSRVRPAGTSDAQDRLASARAYFAAGEVLAEYVEDAWGNDPVVSSYVLAGIAAADAACATALGKYSTSSNHSDAVELLGRVQGSVDAVNALKRLLGLKGKSQYTTGRCTPSDAQAASRWARTLLEFAGKRVR